MAEFDVEDLRQLVATSLELPVEEVSDDADFVTDLGVDSLAAIDILINLEKRFGVKVTDAEFKLLDTFADVRDLMTAKLAGV
ncbi:acyl carrier protein [Actinokineospora guangxiensis]|jgi:acyl carrier protein|uniref:Acyl carrier protein n=1 Tax=Actinokineospora guangxiensis TaxID=1490288 RepID=A0ABW0EJ29_9PSEU